MFLLLPTTSASICLKIHRNLALISPSDRHCCSYPVEARDGAGERHGGRGRREADHGHLADAVQLAPLLDKRVQDEHHQGEGGQVVGDVDGGEYYPGCQETDLLLS